MDAATDWREDVKPDEAERFARHAAALRALQRGRAGAGRADRALHAKTLAGVTGELTVLPDLPAPARAGFFATPATYEVLVRFSNGSGSRAPDTQRDVRGVAIKVLDVPGKKVLPGMEDARTQDFLLIDRPATPFRDADEFVGLVLAARSPLLLVPRLVATLGLRRALAILGALAKGGAPVVSLATTRFSSALAIRYGSHAVRYALEPAEPPAPGGPSSRGAGASPDDLGAELGERLLRGPVSYDFRVQFFTDRASTPIEDGSVEWRSPFVTVARLRLDQQDTGSPRGRRVAARVEELAFDPWHALEEHRPLGDMMRARGHAYLASQQERRAAKEPEGKERFAEEGSS